MLVNEKDVQGMNMILLDCYCALTYTKLHCYVAHCCAAYAHCCEEPRKLNDQTCWEVRPARK